jgi:hypothetical protein
VACIENLSGAESLPRIKRVQVTIFIGLSIKDNFEIKSMFTFDATNCSFFRERNTRIHIKMINFHRPSGGLSKDSSFILSKNSIKSIKIFNLALQAFVFIIEAKKENEILILERIPSGFQTSAFKIPTNCLCLIHKSLLFIDNFHFISFQTNGLSFWYLIEKKQQNLSH